MRDATLTPERADNCAMPRRCPKPPGRAKFWPSDLRALPSQRRAERGGRHADALADVRDAHALTQRAGEQPIEDPGRVPTRRRGGSRRSNRNAEAERPERPAAEGAAHAWRLHDGEQAQAREQARQHDRAAALTDGERLTELRTHERQEGRRGCAATAAEQTAQAPGQAGPTGSNDGARSDVSVELPAHRSIGPLLARA